jgi:hypothetical protein
MSAASTSGPTCSAEGAYMNATAVIAENDGIFREEVLAFVLAIFETDQLPQKHRDYVTKVKVVIEFLQCALYLRNTTGLTERLETAATDITNIAGKRELRKHPVYRSLLVASILLQYPAAKRSGRFFDTQLMLAEYSEICAGLSNIDVQGLLCYRNYMATANEVFLLRTRLNKGLFVDIVAYVSQGIKVIEGSYQELTSGGTQDIEVTNRQIIFEKESKRRKYY